MLSSVLHHVGAMMKANPPPAISTTTATSINSILSYSDVKALHLYLCFRGHLYTGDIIVHFAYTYYDGILDYNNLCYNLIANGEVQKSAPPHFIVPSAGPALELCTVRSSIIAVLSVTGSLQWSLKVDMMDVGLGVSSFGAMPLDNSIHAAGFTCHS